MKRIFHKNEDLENGNSWMSYTDLMSGFLIIFILASLITYKGLTMASGSKRELIEKVNTLEKQNKTLTSELKSTKEERDEMSAQLDAYTVNKTDFDKIQEFINAQKNLNSDYFIYNSKYQRFECKINVQFEENKYVIPSKDVPKLKAAGKELLKIIQTYSTPNISFKVVIDGRAAKNLDEDQNKKYFGSVQELSYNRARSLYTIWAKDGTINDMERLNAEVFISGLGFGGINRYSSKQEAMNKTFIIQVIPYLKFKDN